MDGDDEKSSVMGGEVEEPALYATISDPSVPEIPKTSLEKTDLSAAIQLNNSKKTSVSSKLDSLSKDDLIAYVKKQYISLSNTRKQVEIHKNEVLERDKKIEKLNAIIVQKGDAYEQIKSSDMISMELLDYKKNLDNTRESLKTCQHELNKKDQLLQELTSSIQKVNIEKEEALEKLRKTNGEMTNLHQMLEEKSTTISENSKEINMLVIKIAQMKGEMKSEIKTLNETIALKTRQSVKNKHIESVTNAELKQLKSELESLQINHSDLQQEYEQFKERAQYVLKQQQQQGDSFESNNDNNNGGDVEIGSQRKNKSVEFQELIETLHKKNDKIALLTNRCSVLTEELQLSQQHIQNLEIKVQCANTEINELKNNYMNKNIKLTSDFERRTEALQAEIDHLKLEKNELMRHFVGESEKLKTEMEVRYVELLKVNSQLSEDFEKLKLEHKDTLLNSLSDSRQSHERSQKTDTAENKQPKNYAASVEFSDAQHHHHSYGGYVGDSKNSKLLHDNATCQLRRFSTSDDIKADNSESDENDLSASLQSVVRDAENGIPPTSATFNAADSPWNWSRNDEKIYSDAALYEKLNEMESQLSYNRDLLAETEEINIKLVEQVELLKEEIRRIERNSERYSHVAHNSEYLKNVILKFLAPQKVQDERQQLLPILRTMLKLNTKECAMIEHAILGTISSGGNGSKLASESGNSDWTSYIGSLTGMF